MQIHRGCGVLLMSAVLMAGATAFSADKKEESKDVARLPLVVLKQQEVHGRVFFAGDEGENDTPAGNLKVDLYDSAGTNRIVETKTDAEGKYVLPSIGEGVYRLSFGRLTLELRVVEPLKASAGEAKIPKSLLVFLPRSLVAEAESETKK